MNSDSRDLSTSELPARLIAICAGVSELVEREARTLARPPSAAVVVSPVLPADGSAFAAIARSASSLWLQGLPGPVTGFGELISYNLMGLASLSPVNAALREIMPGIRELERVPVNRVAPGELAEATASLAEPLTLWVDTPGLEAEVLALLATAGVLERVGAVTVQCAAESFFEGGVGYSDIERFLAGEGMTLQRMDDDDPDWPVLRFSVDVKARRLIALENTVSELHSANARQGKDLAEARSALGTATAALAAAQGEIKAQAGALAAAKGEVATQADALTAAQGEIKAQAAALAAAKGEVAAQVDALTAAQGEIKAQAAALAAAKGEVATQADALTAAQGEIKAQAAALAAAKAEVAAQADALTAAQREVASQAKSLAAVRAEIEAKDEALSALAAGRDEQASDAVNVRAELKAAQVALAAQRDELATVSAEVKATKALLEDARRAAGSSDAARASTQAELAEARATIASQGAVVLEQAAIEHRLLEELDQSKSAIVALESEAKALRAKVADQDGEAQTSSTKLAKVEADLESARAEALSQQQALLDAQAAVGTKNVALAAAEAKLEEAHARLNAEAASHADAVRRQQAAFDEVQSLLEAARAEARDQGSVLVETKQQLVARNEALEAQAAMLEALTREIDEVKAKLVTAEAEAAEARRQAVSVAGALAAAQAAQAEAEAELVARHALVEARTDALAEANAAIAAKEQTITELQAAVDAHAVLAGQATAAFQTAEVELADERVRSQSLASEMEAVTLTLEQARDAASRKSSALEAANAALAASESRIKSGEALLTEKERQLAMALAAQSSAEAGLTTAQARLEAHRQELHDVRQALEASKREAEQSLSSLAEQTSVNANLKERAETLEKVAHEATQSEAAAQATAKVARDDLSLALRLKAMTDLDLQEIQQRYAQSEAVRRQQEALFRTLTPRLEEAALYIQQIQHAGPVAKGGSARLIDSTKKIRALPENKAKKDKKTKKAKTEASKDALAAVGSVDE